MTGNHSPQSSIPPQPPGYQIKQMKELKASIGLSNPKSPANVGSVLRTAGNFNVESVFYTGERYARAAQLNTITENLSRKVGQHIPLYGETDLIESAPDNSKIVCIELAENAIPLPDYQHQVNSL